MVKREGATIVISGHAPGRDDIAVREPRHSGERFAAVVRQRYREETAEAPYRAVPRPGNWVNLPLENF
jgi:hypothetical protein